MKTIILVTALTLLYVNIFAQEEKPCQFIGLYDQHKRGICSDRAMVNESVKDFAECNLKRTQFIEDHKKENPNTRFIAEKESVIAYEYEKAISGWKCNSKVIGIKTGKSIGDCNKQLADQLAKYPKDFTTQPNTIFTWQGQGFSRNEYTKDYGGLNGRFISGNTATKNIIVAQLTNQTKDKLATVLLRSDDGKMMVEYITPGSTLTKKYDSKKIEIQVIYQDYKAPKPSLNIYEFIKGKVRETIINENGKIKSTGTSTITGVRG